MPFREVILKGDWTQWRGDPRRTGRASVAGRITRPEIVWRHFVGSREDLVVVKAGDGGGTLTLPSEVIETDMEALERRYALGRYLDVDGSGNLVKVTERPGNRYHRLLPGVKGCQRVTFPSAFQVGDKDNYGWLESFEDGPDHPRRVWETERDHTYYMPLIVFSDVDGDGREEIVMTVHYRIMVFDPDTGKKLQELRYHNHRNYGDHHAADLDGDGLDEFVQIVTFQAHMEVIDNDGGQLKLAWYKEINEGIITRPARRGPACSGAGRGTAWSPGTGTTGPAWPPSTRRGTASDESSWPRRGRAAARGSRPWAWTAGSPGIGTSPRSGIAPSPGTATAWSTGTWAGSWAGRGRMWSYRSGGTPCTATSATPCAGIRGRRSGGETAA